MPRDEEGSVSIWVSGLKAGDSASAEKLWDRYFKRLVGLARSILQTTPRRAADEEDVALCAFDSVCRRASQGKFPQLENRDDLWKLLMTITVRKAMRLARQNRRRPARGESDFVTDELADQEPSPEFAALVKDEFERLLRLLDDPKLRRIALLKLEGYTNREIAGQFGRSTSYVERKLQAIRRAWSHQDQR